MCIVCVHSFTPGIIELSPCEGILPACSQETIRVTVRPSVRAHYCCKVTYELLPAPKGDYNRNFSQRTLEHNPVK